MSSRRPGSVAIVGGGPAGSVAALCLRRLGREVVLYEKARFPRYRVGESLLPGTLSILARLGLSERLEAVGFPKKRAATFIWGPDQTLWTFTFSTPKTTPWVHDHAYQVDRAEFDRILLEAARERGADVREEHEVFDLQLPANGELVEGRWRSGVTSGRLEADWVIDASGSRGLIATQLGLRRYDEYFRNMAVWSYFEGGKRFAGDLEGNILSVTLRDGWAWLIPLRDDVYSVGFVTDRSASARMKEVGLEAFYQELIDSCPRAGEILATAKRCDDVRVTLDWAYDASACSLGQAFLCGDSACFIDPLFSQGVHLAVYSAMLAAAAIDYLYDHPQDVAEVHGWYDATYRAAYNRYHEFLAAFYACNQGMESDFWQSRKISGATDRRFDGKEWFAAMTGQSVPGSSDAADEIEARALALGRLWEHTSGDVSDDFNETELSLRRLRWASGLQKQYKSMASLRWAGEEVRLVSSFKVNASTFKLERETFLGDETGRTLRSHALTESHRMLFESLRDRPLSYRELSVALRDLGGEGTPAQIVGRLVEANLLRGHDKSGEPVEVPSLLRFGGVGAEDDLS